MILFCNVIGNFVLKIFYFVVGENGIVGNDEIFVINSFSVVYVKIYIGVVDDKCFVIVNCIIFFYSRVGDFWSRVFSSVIE